MATAFAPTTSPSVCAPQFESSPTLKLLILDRGWDRIVREACREAAVSLGYHATATESIEQALWLTESLSIDVVLLDFSFSSAGEVLHQLKDRRAECEVIAVTSNDHVQLAVQAMKAGAFDCLPKPFGLQQEQYNTICYIIHGA